ncbi:carboxymuconolactone decarboxylase family protein [Egibacter rhizosphaerae]|uniref:Carboxymuconolactone decarboxylase family protein n=1 Tax=Egibacter rhizosphaerae TaxID=1670831 RepID=A0A411YDL3_9ACTN|nr:carboxymuconolactone decarboxylase family protein [Egibacter rhizosphaerae]QBI19295.1 carboxymuconolactone decarboxylase family protein [Egibacter rhizosphaerae]
MTSATRVPPAEVTGPFGAMLKRSSRRRFGEVPEALGVMWHSKAVLKAFFGLMGKARKWDTCDPQLKSFAHMATVSIVGCSLCLDLGYFEAYNENLDLKKAREVPRWRESDLFTPLEREVMAYAEAMSQTPPTVDDELSARLREQLGDTALVELTAFIGAANLAARTNVALGLTSQGLAASCGLPPLVDPSGIASAS